MITVQFLVTVIDLATTVIYFRATTAIVVQFLVTVFDL